MDCPVRVWLDEPLGERAVIDFDRDEELEFCVPPYLDNVPQDDHGYHCVGRRRPSAGPKSRSFEREHPMAATLLRDDCDTGSVQS